MQDLQQRADGNEKHTERVTLWNDVQCFILLKTMGPKKWTNG